MKQMYLNGEYLANNPTYDIEDSTWKTKEIIDVLLRNNIHPKKIIDVGCGVGAILNELQKKYNEGDTKLFGFDISPDAIAIAKNKYGNNISFVCADFILSETEYYDLLLCIDVLEHVENYLDFLKALKTRAEYKLFHIPLDMTAHMVIRNSPIIFSRKKYGHLHYYSKDTAILTLLDCGYQILDWHYTKTMFFNDNKTSTKLLNILRKITYNISHDLSVRILGGHSLIVLTK
ncbi:MAG: class I SAM-dependent methyltransferase [Ignavibacteriaceae bacterium]|jgi:SAM-dependent methyltransferase|nr:class I SAM-dependent methyltransferase [Ignavibacteriaceae bacterium]